MKQSEINQLINEQQTIILDREAKLSSKDYIGVKIAMGVAAVEDYTTEIAQTETWRQAIRDANAEIERLKALVPDPEDEEQSAAEPKKTTRKKK